MQPVELAQIRACAFKKRTPHEDGRKRLGCERCDKARSHPDHMGAPPSFNPLGSGNVHLYQHIKRQWEDRFLILLVEAGMPCCERVVVEGEATFPDRTRRDQGNFRMLIEKALGDALVRGGYLEDDDWSHYSFGDLAYRYEKGQSATRLMLFPSI